jgi:PilZ domain
MLKARDMTNSRFVNSTVCKRDVTFFVGGNTYHGVIENMSNYGASIQATDSGCVNKGMTIRLAISCDDQENTRDASVVWTEEDAFGAKFI